MKKIIICVGALGVMSFTSNQIYKQYKLNEAINNIQDMKEWMLQDIELGNIKPVLGEHYMYWLEEAEDNIVDFCESNFERKSPQRPKYPRQVK